jgi:hypothetical protein
MKRSMYMIISMLVLSLTMLGAAWAAESKEEINLRKDAAAIDTTAGHAQGEKVVVQRMKTDFSVTDAQVQGMRDKKMGYGEISIVLSLCKKMPGGATEANIQQVMTMRQGPPIMGWSEVAKKLGTTLGPAVSQVRNVHREVNREMKHETGGDKEHMEKQQERHEDMHKESMGNENMGGGQGMSHGKGK